MNPRFAKDQARATTSKLPPHSLTPPMRSTPSSTIRAARYPALHPGNTPASGDDTEIVHSNRSALHQAVTRGQEKVAMLVDHFRKQLVFSR